MASHKFPTSRPERVGLALGAGLSLLLVVGVSLRWSYFGFTWAEVFGFLSGALCVYLTVKRHIWNFPIGLANNLFFGILFLKSRLFADMTLQGVYFVLGVLGWLWWANGKTEVQAELPVRRASPRTLITLLGLIAIATFAMRLYLIAANGASPLWDALTTALSLAAQYLLSRKWLETWWFWIAADLIYVPLYWERGLYLTSLLYALFLVLCLLGWREWRRALHTPSHV